MNKKKYGFPLAIGGEKSMEFQCPLYLFGQVGEQKSMEFQCPLYLFEQVGEQKSMEFHWQLVGENVWNSNVLYGGDSFFSGIAQ